MSFRVETWAFPDHKIYLFEVAPDHRKAVGAYSEQPDRETHHAVAQEENASIQNDSFKRKLSASRAGEDDSSQLKKARTDRSSPDSSLKKREYILVRWPFRDDPKYKDTKRCNSEHSLKLMQNSDPGIQDHPSPEIWGNLVGAVPVHSALHRWIPTHNKRIDITLLQRLEEQPRYIWRLRDKAAKERTWQYCQDDIRGLLDGLQKRAFRALVSMVTSVVKKSIWRTSSSNYLKSELEGRIHSICLQHRSGCREKGFFDISKDRLFKKEDHEIAKSSLSDNIVELVLRNFQIEKAEFSFENVSKKMDMDTLSDMTQYGPEVFVDGPRSLQGSWSESVASLSGFCINIIHKIFTEALEKKISHHIATEKLETKFCYYPNSGALLDILKRLKAIARIVYIPSKTNAGDPISDKECFDELNEETILGCVKNEHTHYLSNYAACFVNNPQCLLFSKINLRPLSQLDKFVLDNDQWAVSLFVFATSTGSTILAGGHAMVCIEGCENGRYFRWYADLLKSGAKGAVRFIKEIEYADDKYAFNDKKGREHWRSWPLPSSNVRKMIAAIEGEENHPPDFHLLGRFHRINPIRFFSSNAEYNCIDWAIGKCQLAGVPIPNRGILSPTPYKYIESLPSSQGATLSLEERSIYPL